MLQDPAGPGVGFAASGSVLVLLATVAALALLVVGAFVALVRRRRR